MKIRRAVWGHCKSVAAHSRLLREWKVAAEYARVTATQCGYSVIGLYCKSFTIYLHAVGLTLLLTTWQLHTTATFWAVASVLVNLAVLVRIRHERFTSACRSTVCSERHADTQNVCCTPG